MEKSVTEGIFPGMAGLFSPVGTEQVQRLQAAGQPVDPLHNALADFLGENHMEKYAPSRISKPAKHC